MLKSIGCNVTEISYSPVNKTGVLKMEEGHCCDMTACIKLFERIDPFVDRIQTMSGTTPDTVYRRDSGGKWQCT